MGLSINKGLLLYECSKKYWKSLWNKYHQYCTIATVKSAIVSYNINYIEPDYFLDTFTEFDTAH